MSLQLIQQNPSLWCLEGTVNVNTITAIIEPGYKMIKAAPAGQPLILDLSGVIEADSASVALLIDWMRKAKKKNKVLQFSSLPEKMKDIINVSNLEGIM
jgi:phospholipid transport system transporter-binding protein